MAEPSHASPRRFMILPYGVRAKLIAAFLLTSAVPLVMLVLVTAWFAVPAVRDFYRLDRVFPVIASGDATWWLIGLIALTIAIAFLGAFYLMMKVAQPVMQLSEQAKALASESAQGARPTPDTGDEIGDLTLSLRQVTNKIRGNIVELKEFGAQTSQLNLEINRRVLMLSGLLQIGEMVSNGAELDVVLEAIVEKVTAVEESSFSFLCLQPVGELSVSLRRACRLDVRRLDGLTCPSALLVVDPTRPAPSGVSDTWEQLGRPSLLIQPVTVRDRLIGMLGVGARAPKFAWTPDLMDLVSIFVKQTSIAIENELLLRKAKSLAIRDELTGLYNESYIRQRLAEEIQRAARYQRPCAFAAFSIVGFSHLRQRHGDPEAERILKKVAKLVQDSLSEVDRAGRFAGNEMGIVFPERNKREALEMVEQTQRKISQAFGLGRDAVDRIGVVTAVSENPMDGSTAEELVEKAMADVRQQQARAESKPAGVA